MPQDNPSVGRRVFSRTIAKTLCLHRIFISRVVGSALIVLSLLAVMLFGAFSGFARPQTAIAQAPNTTLNFQARILNLNGSLVPDGDYHIEFKIYDTVSSGGTAQGACSGNCLWMETRTGGDVIRVVNGYVSANLGSVTSFPSNMPWGNNLYVTMRVGGAGGSPSWDAQEMTNSGNRMKMSVAPVAFVANNVASGSTNSASTNSSTISIQSGNALGTTSNSGNITIDSGTATGTTGAVTIGSTNASAVLLGRAGLTVAIQGGVSVAETAALNGDVTIGNANTDLLTISSTIQGSNALVFEGATVDGFETTLAVQDPTADVTLRLPALAAGTYDVCTTSGNCLGTGDIIQGGNSYTTAVTIGTNDVYDLNLETSGVTRVTIDDTTGDVNFTGNLVVAAIKSLTLTGGNTASRPASPTEGMIYFDTDTDSLLTYANGKWQSDRGEYIIVASNHGTDPSTQAERDSADYVTDGTADEVEINAALTAASGGKVILLGGTYVAAATILIPNNTTLAGVGAGTNVELGNLDATDNLIENSDTTTGTGITIRDLTLDGRNDLNTAGTQYGIYLNTGSSSNIESIYLTRFRNYGIYLQDSSNRNTLDNVKITSGSGDAGIGIDASDYNTINNINVVGATGLENGVEIIGGESNTVTGSTFSGTFTERAIYMHDGAILNTVSANTINGTLHAISSEVNSGANIITGNTIFGTTGIGIVLNFNSDANTVTGNNITLPGTVGIYAGFTSDNNTIDGNTIVYPGGATENDGIVVDGDANQITDNYISDSTCSTACTAIEITANADNTYISGNVFVASSGTAIISNSGTATTYANQSVAENGLNTVFRQADSTTAFAIQNNAGSSLFNADTSGGIVTITGSASVSGDFTVDTTTLVVNSTTNAVSVGGTLAVTTLGSADTSTFICRNSSNQLATCSSTPLTNSLTDNITDAFDLQEGANNYININTTNTTENISFGNATTNPSFSFLGSGALTVNGASTFNSSLTAKGQLLADGTSANQTQLIVRANASQTVANPLVLLQNSSSAELARINATTTSLYFGNAAGGNSAAGVNNTGIGASALGSVLTGTGNTTLGSGALASVSVNDNNTAVGYNAGNLATGGNNIFLGALAGDNVTTGTDNIIIGYNLDASASGATNELRIGGVLQGNTSTLAAQFNGALTVTGLLTGNLGATVTGATTNINASSNFGTNINTGTSTGAVAIGNSLAGVITLQSASTIGLTGTSTITGLSAGAGTALTVNNSTSTGSIFVAQDNGTPVFTIADGGASTFTSTLAVNTLGSADTSTFVCRNTSNQLATCSSTPLTNSLTDNITDAFDLQEGTNNYFNINTTNSSENISFGNATTNPSYSFLGSGTLTVTGNTQLNGNLTVAAGKYIALTGGNTASRPGSPTEGMVYFDSTTDSLLAYANGKWQSDRGEFVVVAANDSSQAEKDSADYVADGTADQTEINSALTEAAGGKVILLAGTYVANATILIPNNTILAGAGRGTLIELADLDATDNLIENTDQTTGTGVTIRDIRIDGRDDLNTAGTQVGIYLLNMGGGTGPTARQGAKITNVIANNFRTDGVYLESSSNSTLSGNTFQGNFYGLSVYLGAYNTVTNNIAQGNSQLGFYIGTNNNTFTNNVAQGGETGFYTEQAVSNTISGNTTEGNSYVGYYVDDLSSNNVFTGNTSNTDEDYGFYIIGASTYNSFIGNSVRNSINGFRLENASNNNLISANKIHDSGGATTNNGIYLDASDNNTITGNDISDTGCSTNCYAINIFNSTSDNNYLEGNTFTTSSGTATINDSGTGTRYANQTTAQNGLDILFKQSNSTTAFRIQDSSGGNGFTVNTTTLGISTGGTLAVTGNTTLTADLAVNGNTTIGNATTDRLTVTSYILGANALVFEGATDGNGFATTLQVTDPTANNTIVLPNASGTILIAPAGSGNGLVQVPTSNSAGVAGANVISPTAASIVGLTVNGTTSTAAVALAVAQTGTATAMTVSQTQNNAGLTITANALTTANGLTVSSSGTGLTTGSLISVSSATTGAVATNGIVSLSATGNYTSTSNIGLLSVLANATQAGTIQNIQGNALTTGNALRISSTGTGLTTGSLFYGTSATTGAVATNGIFSLNATGNYTSTSNVGLLNIVANATTAGTVQQIQANALTTGDALNINSSGTGLTTGSLLRVSTATTGAIATDGAVSIQATGNYTSTSGIGLLSVLANTTQAGTVANIQANALTTGDALNISSTGTGLTTGSLLRVSTATTGAIATDGAVSIQATGNYTSTSNIGFVSIQANTTQAGTIQNIQGNALTSGQALYVSSSGTGLTTGSLFYGTSATTSAVATNGIFSLNATGNYTSTSNTGLLNVAANATTAGTITNIQGNALTTGTALNVTSTGTLTTTGNIATFTANSATTATGVVAINATGLTTGSALNVTTGASAIAFNATGRAIVTGTANDAALGSVSSVVATATSATNGQFGINSTLTVSPGSASTQAYGAIIGYATTSSSNLSTGSATISGFNGIAQNAGSGNLVNAFGGGVQVLNLSTGTLYNATGLYIANATNSGGGTITRSVGALVANQSVGTTNINLLLGPINAVGISGNWSIYSNSAYDSSLLGNLRIGSNVAPTVALDVTGSGLITQSSNTNTLSVVNDSLTTATGTALTTTGVLTTTGNLLTLTANSATTATGVLTVNATALTTGAGITVNTGTATAISAGGNITFQEVTGTRVLGVQTRTTNVTGTNLTVQSGQGGTTSAGGLLTLQGGSGGATSGNGGNVMLVGGTATSGTKGLVVVDTATFSAQTVQNFTANANITQASIDSFGSILISGNVAGWIATLTDPTNTTTGRVIYVTNSGSVDMTLAANSVGVALSITLKPASTATMFWNGTDWTAAGASSSTDLQAAYDNTAASAGGAEIVLSSSGTGGLTIRNDDGTAITGGLLEVQTSIGSSLFTVNNNATEYAANGGAESSTFTAWLPASGAPTETVARNTSDTGDIIATGTASASVLTTAVAGQGAENTLTTPLINGLKYQVSYAIKSSSATGSFTELDTMYSYDGTAGNARHCVAGTAYYSTGTASQTTTTITGVGTAFTSAMVGMTFVFADGRSTVISGYTNPTTLTAATSQTASSQNFGVWTAGYKVNSATWTRITCTFTAAPSGTTITASNSVMIRQTSAAVRTFYIDNLSVTVSADVNHAVDGSVDSALGTNWQAYDADGGAGTSTPTRDTTNIYDSSGAVADVTTAHINQGIRNNLTITPTVSTQYLVTFYTKLLSGTFTDITVGFLPAGGNSAPVTAQLCVDYNTRTLSTSAWTKITCIITTPSSGISDPDVVIYQPTATARTFYVDALSVTLNTNNSSNVQIGGGNFGGPTTLFTLDRGSTPPIAANNEAYLGSMYYDTNSGRIQCYEADGWGACGAAPDNIVNLNPEYAGAVLNGTGVGTMTSDFCGNGGGLSINTGLCDSGEAKNFYKWTSPQATQQTYSVYVTYQLPATFNGFTSDDTVQLAARVDNTTNASVTYEMFKSVSGALTQCGSGETNVITGGGGSANTWYSYGINGNEATGCSFNSSSANGFVIFKINMKANSNASAYVGTLNFVTAGR